MADRREFVKVCALGLGACVMGAGRAGALASTLARTQDARGPSGDLGRWSREALFYTETPRGLRCEKCPNACELDEGQTGRCRNRVNREGKMYTIAYGNPCAVHIDPIEKKPLFHFLPSGLAYSVAVAGCNLACLNCQNWDISQASPYETRNEDLMPENLVARAVESRCGSIAYTYSEPTTFYEYAYDTALLAREKGVRNVWKSNGYINERPLRKLCGVMDAANIDLKSFDDDVYARLNAGRLDPVLRTLRIFKEEGVWLEITNLVIPGWTDDLGMIGKMCDWLGRNALESCPLHFTRFHPLYKLNQLPSTPVSTLERAREIAVKAGMKYVYIGNVPGHVAEGTFCHGCSKLIIDRRGFTILSNHVVDGKCEYCGARIPGVWG